LVHNDFFVPDLQYIARYIIQTFNKIPNTARYRSYVNLSWKIRRRLYSRVSTIARSYRCLIL